ncbi:MAG: FUSC family protein, partial [Nocardioidaceae bacterium]
ARWVAWCRWLSEHYRSQLALKAAIAAGLAWQVAIFVPGPASEYPYYAPLGAVLVMYPTLVSSVRAVTQTLAGIGLGAGIALAGNTLASTNAVIVALVVAAGIAVGGWRFLGEQRSWVPIAAIFVLILGHSEPLTYMVGCFAQTLIGALIGAGVNWVLFPPLHLRHSGYALARLQAAVIAQLDDIASALDDRDAPDEYVWSQRVRSVEPMVDTMREAIGWTIQARRANPRARRYSGHAESQHGQAQMFARIALLVEDLVGLFTELERDGAAMLPLPPEVRESTAVTMRRVAALLGSVAAGNRPGSDLDRARRSVDRAAEAVREDTSPDTDMFVSGSIVTCMRRMLGAVADEYHEAPAGPYRVDVFRSVR